MSPILSTLLFATAATAQLTTSAWMPLRNMGGTDKLGLMGSVLAASGATYTAVVKYDNGTTGEARIDGALEEGYTFTFGPNMLGLDITKRAESERTISGGGPVKYLYTMPPTPMNAQPVVMISYPAASARPMLCRQPTNQTVTLQGVTFAHSYPARLSYSGGVETATAGATTVYPTRSTTPTPSWCTAEEFLPKGAPSSIVETVTLKKEDFAYYQLVLTAGVERLSAASAAATKSGSGMTSQNMAAAPLKTAGPVLAGLGAAVAVFS